MAGKYHLLSADSHLEIAPDRWTQRVPAEFRDRAPRRIKLPNGGDGIIVENRNLYILGLAITSDRPFEDHTLSGVSYDWGAGAGPPEQRVREQQQDGLDGEVMFTSAGNYLFWRGIRNDKAYASVVHAYNEFLVEEYCAAAPDRLMAMGLIPITNLEDAITELEYCTKGGLKGVAMGMFPSGKGFPTKEDDRFWAAALDLNIPLTVHVGFIGRQGQNFQFDRTPEDLAAGPGTDPLGAMTRFGGDHCMTAIQLAMAGVFDRFPKLHLYFAETMVGWLPYFLEQADDNWRRDRHWMERDYGIKPLVRQPSEYIRDHCWWGFVYDPYGVKARHDVGISKMMWANDFPHSASDWPNSRELLDKMFAGVPEEERYQITVGNAIDYFHLDD